jgi:coproporphyrinogen dehydrogenase
MPKHEFLLKKTKENIFSKGHSVVISDDLILHILYSLKWVQTTWNDEANLKKGLNYYGYSWIEDKAKFRDIICSWRSLFLNADEQIVFDKNCVLNRSSVIEKLDGLLELIDSAIKNDLYILHLGI